MDRAYAEGSIICRNPNGVFDVLRGFRHTLYTKKIHQHIFSPYLLIERQLI